ncbi:MAG: YgaP family membrane protein [Bacteroidota bacterium]
MFQKNAGIFILTSFIGFCPLYAPFKISTRKKQA